MVPRAVFGTSRHPIMVNSMVSEIRRERDEAGETQSLPAQGKGAVRRPPGEKKEAWERCSCWGAGMFRGPRSTSSSWAKSWGYVRPRVAPRTRGQLGQERRELGAYPAAIHTLQTPARFRGWAGKEGTRLSKEVGQPRPSVTL